MPIYEYLCRACGERFDAVQPQPAPCPPCRKCGEEEHIDRKLTAATFTVTGYNAKNGYSRG
jgi:putative FmdB family regulatory protein